MRAAQAETIVAKLTDSDGGHSTRDIVFSPDGTRLFISVGSASNVAEKQPEKNSRANSPMGKLPRPKRAPCWEQRNGQPRRCRSLKCVRSRGQRGLKIFATGIRNAVGTAVQPRRQMGKLWVSTNERDGLGDDLVPDYISHIQEGGFYGWPWYYLGNHEDPRHVPANGRIWPVRPLLPDVPVASPALGLANRRLYLLSPRRQRVVGLSEKISRRHFCGPAWFMEPDRPNRQQSHIRVRTEKRRSEQGEYEDFLTFGFVVDDSHVWGQAGQEATPSQRMARAVGERRPQRDNLESVHRQKVEFKTSKAFIPQAPSHASSCYRLSDAAAICRDLQLLCITKYFRDLRGRGSVSRRNGRPHHRG